MPPVTCGVSEADLFAANSLALRDEAWVRWVIWIATAVVALAIGHAGLELGLRRGGPSWPAAEYVFALGAVGAFAAYNRRWGLPGWRATGIAAPLTRATRSPGGPDG